MDNKIILLLFALVLFYIFLYSYKKSNRNVLSVFLSGVYFLISFFCFLVVDESNDARLNILNYLFFTLIFFIQIFPFIKRGRMILKKIYAPNLESYIPFANIYLISTFVYIVFMIPKIIPILQSGSYHSAYLETRGEDAILYNGFFEQVIINFVSYSSIIILVLSFLLISNNVKYKYKLLLFIFPFLNSLIFAVMTASRASVAFEILIYLVLFLVFRNKLPLKFSRVIKALMISIVAFATLLIGAITLSRFGDSDNSWLYSYFAESFYNVNYIMTYGNGCSNGNTFFKGLFEFNNTYHCSIDFGFGFTTLIGARFRDFGYVGTIIYAIICFTLINKLLKKKVIDICTLVIIIYYFRTILIGVFYDAASCLSWIYMIIIVLIFKYMAIYIFRNYKI